MRLHLGMAWSRVRARPGRALLAWLGVAAVGVMVGASVTVAYSLATGFDRAAARTGMPDVIASFDPTGLAEVRSRVRALPDLATASYRLQQSGVPARDLSPGRRGRFNQHAVVQGVMPGRRGYAIVAGRDLSGASNEVVIERGLAASWHVHLGDLLDLRGFGHPHGPDAFRVVGVAVAADTVAFPLASGPRVWVPYRDARRLWFQAGREPVNQVLLWARDPHQLPVLLEQARLAAAGIGGFTFTTRDGVRLVVDGAAGIVIALLVAFSLMALASGGVMLAAASVADVQRRLGTIGAVRAFGGSRLQVVAGFAVEALAVGLPASALGIAAGWALAAPPTTGLLRALNEFPAGAGLAGVLGGCLALELAVVCAAAAIPAWRAGRRQPAQLLRGGELAPSPRGRWLPSGALGLGARMAASRPLRTAATAVVVGASGAVVLLLLALAGLLDGLEHNPGSIGRRYALTVPASPRLLPVIDRIPGVQRAAPRYTADAADSFDLGESFQLIAYPGDPSAYENPPLASGRRVRSAGEADVGVGLAGALSLHVGSTLAAELPTGAEARFRVVGIVRSLQNDGRLAYVQPPRLLAADPFTRPQIVVVAAPSAVPGVRAAIGRLGIPSTPAGGVTVHNAQFLALLADLLRTVAGVDGLVCLYAVLQMLALTAAERRAAVATLRALGAGPRQFVAVFAGAALMVAVPAMPVAVATERWILGPRTAALATGYVQLSLAAGALPVAVVAAGLAAVTGLAAGQATRSALRSTTATAMRES